jgi:hypothetical protein
MSRGVIATCAALALLLHASAARPESFRCGQWIASPDMSVEELLEKCGEPTSRTVETVDVYGHSAQGGRIKTGTSTVERLAWGCSAVTFQFSRMVHVPVKTRSCMAISSSSDLSGRFSIGFQA